jgi:hypothetical protein
MYVVVCLTILCFILESYGFTPQNNHFAVTFGRLKTLLPATDIKTNEPKELFKGNPIGKMMWDWLWQQDFMKPSESGVSPTKLGDAATVLRNNIEQVYGGAPSIDGAPIAEGEVKGMLEGSLFLGLQSYYEKVLLLLLYI